MLHGQLNDGWLPTLIVTVATFELACPSFAL